MTLQAQLEEHKAKFLQKVPPEVAAVMSRATEDLRASGIVDRAIKPGAAAPVFSLPDEGGQLVSLSDLLSQGWLILSFYRGVW